MLSRGEADIQDFFIVRVRSTVIIVFGEVVTNVLGEVAKTIRTFGRPQPMAHSANCVLTMTERTFVVWW